MWNTIIVFEYYRFFRSRHFRYALETLRSRLEYLDTLKKMESV